MKADTPLSAAVTMLLQVMFAGSVVCGCLHALPLMQRPWTWARHRGVGRLALIALISRARNSICWSVGCSYTPYWATWTSHALVVPENRAVLAVYYSRHNFSDYGLMPTILPSPQLLDAIVTHTSRGVTVKLYDSDGC